MHTGSELLETWIPDGGFMIERRKLKTADGGSAVTDCLVRSGPTTNWPAIFPAPANPACTASLPNARPTPSGFCRWLAVTDCLQSRFPRPQRRARSSEQTRSRPSRSRFGGRRFRRYGPAWNCGIRLRTVRNRSGARTARPQNLRALASASAPMPARIERFDALSMSEVSDFD